MSENYPIIGAVLVNKAFVEHYDRYECPAWWEDRQAIPGVYPVRLQKSDYVPHYYQAVAEISARVVDDYFPALWGGVAVSSKPYQSKYIGQSRTILQGKKLVEAIKLTGNIPTDDVCWYIDCNWWQVAYEEAQKDLTEAYERLPEFWKAYQAGEDEFCSRVRMVAHFGKILHERGLEIEELTRCMKYWQDSYFHRLYTENTAWAKVIEITKA